MKILHWPRRSGKTTELVAQTVNRTDTVLLVANYKERDRILREYRNQPLDPRRIIAIEDAPKRLLGLDATRVVIDNLEMCLATLFGREVAIVTTDRSQSEVDTDV